MKPNKLLVVVDMQNDFITGPLGSRRARAIVDKVCEKIITYDNDAEVVYTMDTHFAEYYDETVEGQNLPVKHCIYETEGHKLHANVAAALALRMENRRKKCRCFPKACFGSTALGEYINSIAQERTDIVTVELIGLCTDVCVLANAIMAQSQMPNVKVVVDAACCAGTSTYAHSQALETMVGCGIQVINEED